MTGGAQAAWIWSWIPEEGISGRADRAILEALESKRGQWRLSPPGLEPPTLTRSQIQRLISEGRVLAGGSPLKASAKLVPGIPIEIHVPAPRPLELKPEERPLEFLYQDEHIVVVNKPPGLTVHPSETQMEGTLVHALLHHVKDLSGIGGVLRPGIVHRIDKDTSGALVITKTDAAHAALSETFSKHEIERTYWALCYGAPKTPREGLKIDTLLGRSPADRKKMSTQVKEGRRAMTWIRALEAYGLPSKAPFASLIEARLETGRTHQVRVHLTSIHHSILGDPVYGTPTERQPKWTALPRDAQDRVRALPGQALHARTLGFKHPITGEPMRFVAEPPEGFSLLLETLRRYRS